MTHLDELIKVSRFYGNNAEYIIAGGGNTSYKNEDVLYIKASGISLATIDEGGFVKMSRTGLSVIEDKAYPDSAFEREDAVKADMAAAVLSEENLRPSVETSLHNLIAYRFVVHTHPTLINGLMCANNVVSEVEKRFGADALYMEYAEPGYNLFKELHKKILKYEADHKKSPQIIFLQNHGVFVAADTIEEIDDLYVSIDMRIKEGVDVSLPEVSTAAWQSETVSAIKDLIAERGLLLKALQSELTKHFLKDLDGYEKIRLPFSPEIIMYCKSNYLYLEEGLDQAEIETRLTSFENKHAYYPKVILEQGGGLIAVEENEKSVNTILEVYQNLMKISYLSEQFGGPHVMSPEQILFIDNWEVENYRRSVAKGS